MRGRVVLVLVDGVGDVSVPSFGDRTPLQVAHTPNMDAIAGKSGGESCHHAMAGRIAPRDGRTCCLCATTPSRSRPVVSSPLAARSFSTLGNKR